MNIYIYVYIYERGKLVGFINVKQCHYNRLISSFVTTLNCSICGHCLVSKYWSKKMVAVLQTTFSIHSNAFLEWKLWNFDKTSNEAVLTKFHDARYRGHAFGHIELRKRGFIPDSKFTIGSTSTRHRSDTFASDLYLIDVDPTVFAIWAQAEAMYAWNTRRIVLLYFIFIFLTKP